MKCSSKYVGLDVHQATTVATVRESAGKIIARSILPTEEAALLEFFAGMRGAVHVAFEEGTQAQWLHDLLSPRVARVVVCDRRGARPRRMTPPRRQHACFPQRTRRQTMVTEGMLGHENAGSERYRPRPG